MNYTLHHGDCLDILRTLPDNSVDSIVTDPPYGLFFMGKRWDYDVPSEDIWRECLRVLKPGGHLLAFAGTRTQHRMAVRIEDAGFEIRDMIAWVYGSGFPKSLDVSKAIDKANAEVGRLHKFTSWMRTTGLKAAQIDRITATNMGGHYLTAASQPAIPTPALWELLRPHCSEIPDWVDELVARIAAEREVVGTDTKARSTSGNSALPTVGGETVYQTWDITAPATPAARQWHGWGTALKPALEPITVARKPLIGTVAENVLTWGTGGVNVDGCRVASSQHEPNAREHKTISSQDVKNQVYGGGWAGTGNSWDGTLGRWPANLIHDGSEEVVGLFPETKSGVAVRSNSGGNTFGGDNPKPPMDDMGYADSGSAARFFYCAKASKADRNSRDVRNIHATVKPTDLMRYLCRLVTPPNGIVLDPFMGSGSTGKAAMLEDFAFIGIEREAEYLDIARARIQHAKTPEWYKDTPCEVKTPQRPQKRQLGLFNESAKDV